MITINFNVKHYLFLHSLPKAANISSPDSFRFLFSTNQS